jgi:septal ring factor EnvC (AmiA/AmiB activator)
VCNARRQESDEYSNVSALLQYQQQQRDKVVAELTANEDELSALKQSIVELNQKLVKRSRRPRSGITATDIQSLKDENQRLRMAITLMAQQIDSMTSEQDGECNIYQFTQLMSHYLKN